MSSDTRQQVARAVKAIEGKKGEDIVILEMDKNSGAFTDYFVVCSGTNPRQLQAIADDVQKQLEEAASDLTAWKATTRRSGCFWTMSILYCTSSLNARASFMTWSGSGSQRGS